MIASVIEMEKRNTSLIFRSWWLAMMVLVQMSTDTRVNSQSDSRNNYTHAVRRYCSQYGVMNDEFFLRNLNTTLSSLRRQLSNATLYHAVARTIINGESVYGLALCREYLTNSECLKCFDIAAKEVRVYCGIVNGGHVIYDECSLRYENHNFYAEANVQAHVGVCGNQTSSQPTLIHTAKRLFSDLRVATPRRPSFYAASTRQVTGSNVTIYAIAQCNINISQSDCAKCLSTRSTTLSDCLPNTFGRAIDAGCFMRYSNTAFFKDNQTTDLTPFLKDGNFSTKGAIIGGVVGGSSFILIIFILLLWHRSKKSSYLQKDKSTGATEMLQGPMAYSHNDLLTATKNFSNENKIGEGSFGKVYKGTLNDGEVVAIKKITMFSRGRKAYNDNELTIISNVHHRHLMRLLGYCIKGPHLFLVLEFMENGSLDKFLYGENRGSLTWKQRFEIIFGIARGLAYLHEQYHVTIIHRDIKSSNILLDNDFQPKISDFGLVRLLPEDKTHVSTKVAGTFGMRCTDGIENGSITHNLVDHAWNQYENGTHLNLIDTTLDTREYVVEDVKKIIELALACTQSQASTRPSMSEVLSVVSDKSRDHEHILSMRPTFSEPHAQIPVDTSTSASS